MKQLNEYVVSSLIKQLLSAFFILCNLHVIAQEREARNQEIRANFTWEMEERFGVDENEDDFIDLNNNYEYVNPSQNSSGEARFKVKLNTVLGNGFSPLRDQLNQPSKTQRIADYQSWKDHSGIRLVSCLVGVDNEIIDSISLNGIDDPKLIVDLLLPEGTHKVSLTILGFLKDEFVYNSYSETIRVKNILIVGMGDSYSSGEGSPDQSKENKLIWAKGTTPEDSSQHEQAHRSTLAWSAQAALMLEKADPKTSVTYINLASSGASVEDGILKSHNGLPPQVKQTAEIIGDRKIDVLFMSIGGNDAGFFQTLAALILREKCSDVFNSISLSMNKITRAIRDGNWERMLTDLRGGDLCEKIRVLILPYLAPMLKSEKFSNTVGTSGLSEVFSNLNEGLKALKFENLYLMEYPNIAVKRDGSKCGAILDGVAPDQGFQWKECINFRIGEICSNIGISINPRIKEDEINLAEAHLLNPLNAEIQKACGKYGWQYFSGINDLFVGHPICAEQLTLPDHYPGHLFDSQEIPNIRENWTNYPGMNKSWFRSHGESKIIQGDLSGTAHPNEFGHIAIAYKALGEVKDQFVKKTFEPLIIETERLQKESNIFYPEFNDVCELVSLGQGSRTLVNAKIENEFTKTIFSIGKNTEFKSMPIDKFVVKYKLGNRYIAILPGTTFIDYSINIKFERSYNKLRITFLDEKNQVPVDASGRVKSYWNGNIVSLQFQMWHETGFFEKTEHLWMLAPPKNASARATIDEVASCLENSDVIVDPCDGIIRITPPEGPSFVTPIDPLADPITRPRDYNSRYFDGIDFTFADHGDISIMLLTDMSAPISWNVPTLESNPRLSIHEMNPLVNVLIENGLIDGVSFVKLPRKRFPGCEIEKKTINRFIRSTKVGLSKFGIPKNSVSILKERTLEQIFNQN